MNLKKVIIASSVFLSIVCSGCFAANDYTVVKAASKSSSTNKVHIIAANEIKFQDAKLEAAIRKAINKPKGKILITDVKKVKKLNLSNKQISNIQGLQHFKALTDLKLNNNNIKDISYLSGLTNLVYLEVNQNQISNIGPVKYLKKLACLWVMENRIKDITPLKGLTSMGSLDLRFNMISNVSALSNMKKIEFLGLSENPIRDIKPLMNLKKIKRFYLTGGASSDKLDNQLIEKYNKIDKKVKEIIAALIKPEMTQLEKELALHDYIVTHVRYDYDSYIKNKIPAQRHSVYGALMENLAVCDGYSKSLQLLLNAVGIETMVVNGHTDGGSSLGHSWNIVKIDEVYYQVDATWNDPINKNELSHRYFNISDKQLGMTHKWTRKGYPACRTENAGFYHDIEENKSAVITTNEYFFIDDNKNIVTKTFDWKTRKVLSKDKVRQFVLVDDNIYYINDTNDGKIYRMKTDGTLNTELSGNKVWDLEASTDSIYFLRENKVFRRTFDGTIQTQINNDFSATWVDVINDKVLYKSFNFGTGGRLIRADLNGENKVEICPDEPYGFLLKDNHVSWFYKHNEHIVNDWIYFINNSDQRSIYKVKIDGSEKTKISADSVTDSSSSTDIDIVYDYIYYKNSADGDKYYRVKIDGTGRQAVE